MVDGVRNKVFESAGKSQCCQPGAIGLAVQRDKPFDTTLRQSQQVSTNGERKDSGLIGETNPAKVGPSDPAAASTLTCPQGWSGAGE